MELNNKSFLPAWSVVIAMYMAFKPGTHGQGPRASGFLNPFLFACQYVHVCPPLRVLTTSGMIWCHIGRE